MLPEPLTSPPRALGRVAYAAGVGFLMYCGMSVEVTSAYTLEFVPEIALLFGCLFTFVVRLAAGSAVRAVIDVSAAESLADRTWLTRSAEVSAAGFLPGQWASLSAPSWSALLWGRTRRVFSFVNAPGQPTEFAFTANEPVSDFKRDLIEGRTRRIYLDDVGGDFALPRSPLATRSPLVLIASGIGITPIVSMVRTLDARQLAGCTVIHVVRTADRATFGDDLAEARAAGAQVVVIESAELADGLDSETLTGLLGEAERSGDQRRPHYFVSGNPEFVRRTSAAIRRSDPATRTNRIRLHRDAFTGY